MLTQNKTITIKQSYVYPKQNNNDKTIINKDEKQTNKQKLAPHLMKTKQSKQRLAPSPLPIPLPPPPEDKESQARLTNEPLSVRVVLFVGCLTSQQQASVSQGRICLDNFTCCHTEIEVADQTFYLTQSQYTDTGPTSPSADPISPGVWQGSRWSANFEVTGMTRPRKNPGASGTRTRDLPLSRRMP